MPYHRAMKDVSRKKIVIDDVAKKAQVSTATVSRVINGFEGVSPEVARRVNMAIEELGYIKTTKQKENTSRHIGVIIPSIQNPFFCNLITEIQNTMENLDYTVSVMDSQNSPQKAVTAFNTLMKAGINGLIYIPTPLAGKEEEKLLSREVPTVLLDRKLQKEGVCFVGSETFTGAYNGANYLLSLGHTKILYLTGNRDNVLKGKASNIEKDRFNGFLKAYNEKGHDFDYSYLISGEYNINTSAERVRELLGEKEFTAIFASADIMAFGAYQAVIAKGLNIPGDISILGYDDLPVSSALNLTTIAQNAFSLGQNAGLLLNDLITGKKEGPQEVILPTNLCIRSSCGISTG